MANMILTLVLLSLHILTSQCMVSTGRHGHGFIGYGIDMYDPNCAYSCRAVISSTSLNCSTYAAEDGMDAMDMSTMESMNMTTTDEEASTSADCYATDDIFLQTLAWCISSRCDGDVPIYELETWWSKNVAGRQEVQPQPKYSYQQALAKVSVPPVETLVDGDPLNTTSLVADADYISNWNAQQMFEEQEIIHEKYGLVVLLCGFVIPIGFSLLRFIPFPGILVTKFNSIFVTPPLWGSHHVQPVFYNLVQIPTRGQSFFIAYLIILNFILSAVNFASLQPNAWYPDGKHDEVLTYVSNRFGVLSFANIPLLFLYAGRNNVLLWLTNWSHSTFILLHRWIAFIATLQAALHSAVWLQNYLATDSYTSESKLQYWYWGIIATLAMCILLPSSVIPIRQKMYEVFLLWHIALSVLVIAGCYLHIYYRFEHQWGYELWIIIAMAVWGFDRIMRLLKMARNGICRAQITPVGEDYIRIDIKGTAPGIGHAYLYFPTLTWRLWENHPFSVASSTFLPHVGDKVELKKSNESDLESGEARTSETVSQKERDTKDLVSTTQEINSSNSFHLPPTLGLTFFVRARSGLTSQLALHPSIPVLVESIYGQHEDLSSYPSLICIAGGVGITGIIPYLQGHSGSKKLYWGVRNEGIAKAMEATLDGFEKKIFIGRRMMLRDVLEDALSNSSPDGAAVVVSGPFGMADEVRVLVSEIGKRGVRKNIKLVEESFSW